MSLYPLHNYDYRPQSERDIHMAKIQWIVNKAMGTNYYKSKYIDMVARFMCVKPNTLYEELLSDSDFSDFSTS